MPAPPPWCCIRLFEEQIDIDSDELDRFITEGSDVSAESTASHFPDLLYKVMGPEAYLEHIAKCKQAVKIPIIASLNGTTTGGWMEYAKEMQQAGADALELNIYYIPVDPDITGDQVEQTYLDLVHAVKQRSQHPGRGEARPLLQLHGQHGANGWTAPAPMAWCSSIASISRISTWKRWKSFPT